METSFDLSQALAVARTRALAAGALVPLEQASETIVDGGVAFAVVQINVLALKDALKLPRVGDKAAAGANPFLPYDPALHVAALSPTHAIILNKYPTDPGHLLMVTTRFVEQETPLDPEDIEAIGFVLSAADGLVFYNSGGAAGASQRHRHIQMVPGLTPPLASLVAPGDPADAVRLDALPFDHLFWRFPPGLFVDKEAAIRHLRGAIGTAYERAGATLPPYNLLITHRWMLFVPRRVECVEGLSMNALGYAGLIGLRTPDQIEIVRRLGPMHMLAEAAGW